jgi:hypothetical protein
MKQRFVSAISVVAIMLTACGQSLDVAEVPDAVKTSFTKQYPGATATWEKEDGKYEAGFEFNGNNMSAVFQPNGMIEESEMEMKESDLPQSILAYLKEHYKGKSIEEASKITMADGTLNYEAEIGEIDVMFDANGVFLKEIKD